PDCLFFSSRRRHTRSKRDWSSDVCSSDLTPTPSTSLGDDFLRIGEKLKIPLHLLKNPFFFHLSSGPIPFWSISGLFSLSKYPVRNSFTIWMTVFFTRFGVGNAPKAGSEI